MALGTLCETFLKPFPSFFIFSDLAAFLNNPAWEARVPFAPWLQTRTAFHDSRVRLYCWSFVAHRSVVVFAEQAHTSPFAREVVFCARTGARIRKSRSLEDRPRACLRPACLPARDCGPASLRAPASSTRGPAHSSSPAVCKRY